MKILVSYAVNFEVEVPKEKILDAMRESEDTLDLGGRLNELAQKFCPAIATALDVADDAEISGVYQSWVPADKPYTYTLPEDDIDEVIWEI